MHDRWTCAGKRCMVTGATSGHGEAVAKALARSGADLVLLGRSREKLERVRGEIATETGRSPELLLADLSSFADIRRAAVEFLANPAPLHILINNAGLVNQGRKLSRDGIEETFAVNYLAMFLLTGLLKDRLVQSMPARIINVASDTYKIAKLDLADVDGRGKGYSLMGAYGRSKLAIVHYSRELARRLAGTGVTVNMVDPGPVASGIAKKPGALSKIADIIIQLTFPAPGRAARTAIHLATSPELDGRTGEYWRFMHPQVMKLAGGADFGERLWVISERLVGSEPS